MVKIKSIVAREIKDSRGNPTVEVVLETDKNEEFFASVPSGASTGANEAWELRDADGKGVLRAIENVNKIIAPALRGKPLPDGRQAENQKEIDELMIDLDGTENKSKLGANAILAVSIAVCRAGAGKTPLYAYIRKLLGGQTPQRGSDPLPLGMFNLIEGGRHAKNGLAIQEFMIVPQKKSFSENLALCNKIFNNLAELAKNNYRNIAMGDEGGFAPQIEKTEQALYLLKNAIGNEPAKIALDAAASEFYEDGKYIVDGQEFSREGLLGFYNDLINNFKIISIEDPFDENDWNGFEEFSKGGKITVIGDDLTTTNIKRIKEAHSKKACNGVIIKPNQIGAVSEAIEAAMLAKSYGWKIVVSHRSGETMDDFIADLAVGVGADFIKSGSPAKEERMAKYKRLLEIENG